MEVDMRTAALLAILFAFSGVQAPSAHLPKAGDEQPKWFIHRMPVTLLRHEGRGYGWVSAEGFWESTSSDKDKQLIWPIAVKLNCDREEKVCREADATVELGLLKADTVEYEVSSWTDKGIIADDSDECNRHTLAIQFASKSVTVTDYPLKTGQSVGTCTPLSAPYSYAFNGGYLQLYPPAPWDALAK